MEISRATSMRSALALALVLSVHAVSVGGCTRYGFDSSPPDLGRSDGGGDIGDAVSLDAAQRAVDAPGDARTTLDGLKTADLIRSDGAGQPDATARPDTLASPDATVDGASSSQWVTLQPGSFLMGSPLTESCRETDEDLHSVTLTRTFEMQRSEVTQGDFELLMGYNPSNFNNCGLTCPVERVTWHEAAAYCNALSSIHGHASCYSCSGTGADTACQEAAGFVGGAIYDCPGYRLPTEAEWEYAYRAGTQTPYYNGQNDPTVCTRCQSDATLDLIGWHCGTTKNKPLPVAQLAPNQWNLHDLAGNVWEWCHDRYVPQLGFNAVVDPVISVGSERVERGGSWWTYPGDARAASRASFPPTSSAFNLGFRCCRTQ